MPGGRVCLAAEEFARALNSRKPSTMPRPKAKRPPSPGFTLDDRNPRRRRASTATEAPVPPPPPADAVAAAPLPEHPPPGFDPEDKNPHRPRKLKATKAAAAAPAVAPGGGDLVRAFGRCRALLDELLRQEDGWVFSSPVDARALGLRDYYVVVRDPMDLGTVLRRLERRRYAHPHAFADDVRLTFRNALSYNNEGDPVYNSALELSEIFEAGWARALPTLPPPPPPTIAERKARLKDQLPLMPARLQESASVLLEARGACLAQKKLEVETDLDKADAATLDELDRLLAEHLPSGGR